MRRTLSSLLRSFANLLNPPPKTENEVRVSPEQLRTALADMFRDPETRRLIFPATADVRGGEATPKYIMRYNTEEPPIADATVTPIFEDPDNERIGIGTLAPATKLHVLDDAAANDATTGEVTIGAGADATLGPLNLVIKHHPSATGEYRFVEISASDSQALRNLVLQGTASGKVGIGTTAPAFPLHVKVNTTSDPVLMLESPNAGDGLSFAIRHSGATVGFGLAGNTGHFLSTAAA